MSTTFWLLDQVLRQQPFVQGVPFENYNIIGMISITSFILALIINGTIGVKTGKTTSDKYHLSITPPSWAFSIWGIIFTSTLLALIWSIVSVTWSLNSHVYFWIYCVVISIWIFFWAWGTFTAVTISKILLFILTIDLFMLWRSTLIVENPSIITQLMRCTLAFQLGWCSSAQCLNLSIFLVYGPLKISQQMISKLIWIFLLISHGSYIYIAKYQCDQNNKNFITNFGGYFLSMTWAVMGVFISYIQINQQKKKQ